MFKVDWRLARRFRGDHPSAHGRQRCMCAARWLSSCRSEQRRVVGRGPGTAVRAARAADTRLILSRARPGKHTAWAHSPMRRAGSAVDMLPRIEAQIERFAPGFRDRILARSVASPADVEGTTRTSSAATSAPGVSRPVAVLHAADVARLFDAGARPLSLSPRRRLPASACTACAAISPAARAARRGARSDR